MNAIQRLLNGIGQRLIAWGAATKRAERRQVPSPPVAPNLPFDAKQHWLDRVSHLPPQAWQQARRAAPPKRAPVCDGVSLPGLPPRVPRVPTARRAPEPERASPPVASHRPGTMFEVPGGLAVRSGAAMPSIAEAARGMRTEAVLQQGALVPPAGPVAAPIYAETSAQRNAQVPPAIDATVPRARPARIRWPVERPASAPPLHQETPAPSPAASRIFFAETRDAARAPVAVRRETTPQDERISGRGTPRHPPPIAAFDLKRTHAPELPPPPMLHTAPPSHAEAWPRATAPLEGRRIERHDAVDSNPPAHGWPDLPPWPAPPDPQTPCADPQARDRRRRLEHEQRG